MTRHEFESKLARRAHEDAAFRQELIKHPSAVVARELSKVDSKATLPHGIEVKIVEETPTTMYLVLPPAVGDGELSETQLDAVAGGWFLEHGTNNWISG